MRCRNKNYRYLCEPVLMNGLFDPWCNGNTADFGSVIPGSNPGGSTTSDKQLFIRRFFMHIR